MTGIEMEGKGIKLKRRKYCFKAMLAVVKRAASCEKGPDDRFCPFSVLSFFAHFIPQPNNKMNVIKSRKNNIIKTVKIAP